MRALCRVPYRHPHSRIVLHGVCHRHLRPYSMSGTDVTYSAIGLRASYAMSGTDLAYDATTACCTASASRYGGRCRGCRGQGELPTRCPVPR
eukprot:558392-Rhodomonas_salina.2